MTRGSSLRADPLAMQLYRARRDAIKARLASGEITQDQAVLLYRGTVNDLMERRGDRIELAEPAKDQDGPDHSQETRGDSPPDGAA